MKSSNVPVSNIGGYLTEDLRTFYDFITPEGRRVTTKALTGDQAQKAIEKALNVTLKAA